MKAAGAIIGGLLLIVAITVGGYQLGWWLKAENTNRQVKIDNLNTGTQTAWHDQATQDVRDFYILPDGPAKAHVRNEACDLIARLSDPYVDDTLDAFQMENC